MTKHQHILGHVTQKKTEMVGNHRNDNTGEALDPQINEEIKQPTVLMRKTQSTDRQTWEGNVGGLAGETIRRNVLESAEPSRRRL